MERTDRARTRTWPRMNGFWFERRSDCAPEHSNKQTSVALAAGRARGPAQCRAGPKPWRLGAADVASRVRKPGIRPPLTQPLQRASIPKGARHSPAHPCPSRHRGGRHRKAVGGRRPTVGGDCASTTAPNGGEEHRTGGGATSPRSGYHVFIEKLKNRARVLRRARLPDSPGTAACQQQAR